MKVEAPKNRHGERVGAFLLAACIVLCASAVKTSADSSGSREESPGAERFFVRFPIRAEDAACEAMGIWPFGVHGADHASDGHPGWDLEIRPGASAYAAADGVVQSAWTDTHGGRMATTTTIQVHHRIGSRNYRTVYTNVASVHRHVYPGAAIRAGDTIGVIAVQTRMIGRHSITYAAFHFQVDDFSVHTHAGTNDNAVSPESVLDPQDRTLLERLWSRAAYNQELCEPGLSNDREAPFPRSLTWTRSSGTFADMVRFSRHDPRSNDYTYELHDQAGLLIERGRATVVASEKPWAFIDFVNESGMRREGVWIIEKRTLTLAVSAPGERRPTTLATATHYTVVP